MTTATVPESAPFVVVGAGMAAARPAAALARATRQPVVLVGAERMAPYDRRALSKSILQGDAGANDISLHRPGQLQSLGIVPLLGRRALALDPDHRLVELDDGTTMGFGELLVATGRRTRSLDVEGFPLAGVETLREMDDALVLAEVLRGAERIVVVGAGLIGLEVAAAARRHGCAVTVVDPLAGRMPGPVGEAVRCWHEGAATEMRFGDRPVAFADRNTVSGMVLASGDCLPTDHLMVGVSSVPCAEWTGLAVATDGTLHVDDAGSTAVAGVWACGDVASWTDPTFGHVAVEHETVAQAHVGRVAMAMAGRPGRRRCRSPGPNSSAGGWSRWQHIGRDGSGVGLGVDGRRRLPPGQPLDRRGHSRSPGVATPVLGRLQRGEPTTVEDVVAMVGDALSAAAGRAAGAGT